MRRFTRLTNTFSKKFEKHMHMVAIYTVWYNFRKRHKSLKGLTPAIAADVSDALWSMRDLAEMVDATMPKPGKGGPYKPRGKFKLGHYPAAARLCRPAGLPYSPKTPQAAGAKGFAC